ncbi:MAG: hypothetical protein ACI9TO_000302 [Rickettsiales bacterium]|jgi:hypothetical protein
MNCICGGFGFLISYLFIVLNMNFFLAGDVYSTDLLIFFLPKKYLLKDSFMGFLAPCIIAKLVSVQTSLC